MRRLKEAYYSFKEFTNNYEKNFVKIGRRWVLVGGKYKLDRYLFGIISLFFIFSVVYSTVEYFSVEDHFYAKCPEEAQFHCDNPFYTHCDGELGKVCNQEFIDPGASIGVKPSWISLNLDIILLATLLLYAAANTLIHNRRLIK